MIQWPGSLGSSNLLLFSVLCLLLLCIFQGALFYFISFTYALSLGRNLLLVHFLFQYAYSISQDEDQVYLRRLLQAFHFEGIHGYPQEARP